MELGADGEVVRLFDAKIEEADRLTADPNHNFYLGEIMTDNIVDRLRASFRPDLNSLEWLKNTSPRIYKEYECFKWISDEYREQIATCSNKCQKDEIPMITVSPLEGGIGDRISLCCVKVQSVKDLYERRDFIKSLEIAPSEIEIEYIRIVRDRFSVLSDLISSVGSVGYIPVFCQWVWTPEMIEDLGDSFYDQAIRHVGYIEKPFSWSDPVATKQPAKKKPVVPEKELEKSLMEWLHAYGIKADNQVTTARQRMDLWIPGHCFLELKKGKVSGDDVCQALDYCSNHKKPVILVGNHISEMASRGIEAFNNSMQAELIVFISWSGVRTYLRGLLKL